MRMNSMKFNLLAVCLSLIYFCQVTYCASSYQKYDLPTEDEDKIEECNDESIKFELVTGYVLNSLSETMETITGVIQLNDCIDHCRRNSSCKAINFETGLCVILSSNSQDNLDNLKPSQFPVFTIYAEKICLKNVKEDKKCPDSWAFERVVGYELREHIKKSVIVISKEDCLESCLNEIEFECRSVNYDNMSKECHLSDLDRHSFLASSTQKYFLPAVKSNVDYYESNCITEPSGLCDFRALKGKILKTVDSIHEDVRSQAECQQKCLDERYRCFSYDYSETSNGKVCRTSHLDTLSVTHIEQPHLIKPDSTTYERVACYNVSIICKAREMIASVSTSKLFSGKIYGKSKPNSCVNDVTNSLNFEITMPYNDVMCDVEQKDQGKFSTDIIIQHHDMVVTTKDIGLSINCNYDLSNKSVTNDGGPIMIDSDFDKQKEDNVHTHTVDSPDIIMKIVDPSGNPIKTAQVGDNLRLYIEISDPESPFQLFIRELVAVDGSDASDIMLIDRNGCPTDSNIMGTVSKSAINEKALEINFDAFKFPTSDIVQFRALVTPCLHQCKPISCDLSTSDGERQEVNSFGRRRRRRSAKNLSQPVNEDDDVVIVQSIKIVDSFEFSQEKNKSLTHFNDEHLDNRETFSNQLITCQSMTSLSIVCMIFLLFQLIIIVFWSRKWFAASKTKDSQINFAFDEKASSSSLSSSKHYLDSTFLPPITVSVSSNQRYPNAFKSQRDK